MKRFVAAMLALCLTAGTALTANAAAPVFLSAKEREQYESYADPAVPEVCAFCGGAMEETSRTTAGNFGATGLTKECAKGTVYTGLDMLEVRQITVVYTCRECGTGVAEQGYERRWACWDLDGCRDCGGRRFLQSTEESAWALTGNVRECEDGGKPYYKDAEVRRTVTKTYACENCGTLETRTDTETGWYCTADEEERALVNEMMKE